MLNILRKYKQLILGILIGFSLTAIPVSAAVKEYNLKLSDCKIMVDGVEYKDKNLPILVMDPGYNYLPAAVFRNICNTIGIGFEFDNTTKQIQIDTKKLKNIPEIEVIKEVSVVEEVPLTKYGLPNFSKYKGERPPIEIEGENMFFAYKGVRYISTRTTDPSKRSLPEGYFYDCPIVDGKIGYDLQVVKKDPDKGWVVVLDNVPYALHSSDRDYYIEYDYYLNTILPLLK